MELRLNISELNTAIYDYLVRTGMQHTAFSFKAECNDNLLDNSSIIPSLETTYLKGLLFQKLKEEDDLNIDLPNGSSEASLKNYIDDMFRKSLGVDLSAIQCEDTAVNKREESKHTQANGTMIGSTPGVVIYKFHSTGQYVYGLEKGLKEIFVIDMKFPDNNKVFNIAPHIRECKPKIIFRNQVYVFSSGFFMVLQGGSMNIKAAFDMPTDLVLFGIYEVNENMFVLECDKKTLIVRDFNIEMTMEYLLPLSHTNRSLYLANRQDKTLLRYDLDGRCLHVLPAMDGNIIHTVTAVPDLGFVLFIYSDKNAPRTNMLGVLRDEDSDFILTAEIKQKFKHIVVYKDLQFMVLADDSIKSFKLNDFDIAFSYKANEPIKSAAFLSDTRILIEFVGNRFKMFDSTTKTTTEIEKTNSAAFMLFNNELNTLIEIKNFETVNLIGM